MNLERVAVTGDYLASVLAAAADVVVVVGADGRIDWVNEAFDRVFGTPPAESLGSPVAELVHADDRRDWIDWLSGLWGSHDGARRVISVRGARADGRAMMVEASAVGGSGLGAGGGVVVTIRDTTARLPYYDDLHARLVELRSSAGGRAAGSGRDAHALVVKVGNLASLLDRHGLDDVESMLHMLAHHVREVTGANDLVAVDRIGELAIVTDRSRSTADIEQLAARLIALGDNARSTGLNRPDVVLGVGVCVVSPFDPPIVTLHRATVAAHRACVRNDGSPIAWEPSHADVIDVQGGAAMQLQRALACGSLVLWFQPICDLRSGVIVGFEGLLRWDRGPLGVVEVGPLLAAAEGTVTMLDIGDFVLAEGCEQLAIWQRDLGRTAPFLAINVSARQFRNGTFAQQLKDQLARSGADPAGLCIELTETHALEREPQALAELAALRTLGVELAFDDFGTGYSSLRHLHVIDADVMKIDRRFVERLGIDDGATAIVRATIDLGAAFGMTTIAEGVCTVEQERRLEAMGCDQVQGFLIAPALPGHAALEFVKAEAATRPERVAEILRAYRSLDAIDEHYHPAAHEIASVAGVPTGQVRRVMTGLLGPLGPLRRLAPHAGGRRSAHQSITT